MNSPTRPPSLPIPSDNSTVVLSPDRDRPSRSPDHGEHATIVPDRPTSPRHLNPAGSLPLPRSPYQGERIPAASDRPGSPNHLGPVGSLPILMGSPDRPPESIAPLISSALLVAFGSDILATSGPLCGSAPIVDINEHVPRVFADDIRSTLVTISYLWDREATFRSQADTIHALQQSHREAVARGDRLQAVIDSLYRSAVPFVSFFQRRYDLMQSRCVDAVHSLRDCRLLCGPVAISRRRFFG